MTLVELDVPGVPAPVGHYTHAVRAGDLLFISGMLALDAAGKLVGGDDPAAQTEAIFGRMGVVLAAAGVDFSAVVKLTTFVTHIGDRAAVNEVRQRVFGTHRPASTLVGTSALAIPGCRIEIEAVALVA